MLFALPGAFFLFLSLYGSYQQSLGPTPQHALHGVWAGGLAPPRAE